MLLEHVHTMDELTDEEFGKFVRAYASYIETGVEPNFSDRSMRMMWKTIKAFDDKNREKYAETSRKRKKAGEKGAEKRWNKDSDGMANDSKNSKCHSEDGKNGLYEYEYGYDYDSTAVAVDNAAPAAPRTDSGLAEIMQHFQEIIGVFPPSALDKLQRWRKIYPAEIIRAAIDGSRRERASVVEVCRRDPERLASGWCPYSWRCRNARRAARKKSEQPQERKFEVLT